MSSFVNQMFLLVFRRTSQPEKRLLARNHRKIEVITSVQHQRRLLQMYLFTVWVLYDDLRSKILLDKFHDFGYVKLRRVTSMAWPKTLNAAGIIESLKRKISSLQQRWSSTRRENERLRRENEQLRREKEQLHEERDASIRNRNGYAKNRNDYIRNRNGYAKRMSG